MSYGIVVDDDELTRLLFERRLSRAGLGCDSYADPEQALSALTSTVAEPARVLFVDRYMPRLDGIELLERLGAERELIARHACVCSAAALAPAELARLDRLGVRELNKALLREPDALAGWLDELR